VVALRLHLDDSLSQNGPLRILPATHKIGVLSDEEAHNFACRIAPIECTVRAGGLLAMRPLIVHASSKSLCIAPRRVLHIEYAANSSIAAPLKLAVA
jgi:phytanoyl-CoA dioxygenase PhyH